MTVRNKSSRGSFSRARHTSHAARTAVVRGRKAPAGKSAAAPATPTPFRNRNELKATTHATPTSKRLTSEGVRLQKALADTGIAARRDCEELILKGRIHLNGSNLIELPCFIDPSRDVVTFDGLPVDLSASLRRKQNTGTAPEHFVYVLLNKPKGVITTARDPEGRPTVLQLIPHSMRGKERLFPVGRLDADSTGLLLLTNDGDLAYQLTHPKFGIIKEYKVMTTGLAGEEQLAQLKRGLYLLNPDKSGQTHAKRTHLEDIKVLKRFVDRSRGDRTLLSIKLREGQNREIRRILARVGLKVRELERVSIGPLRAGELKAGQTKLLGKRDVDRLRAAVLSSDSAQK